MKKNKFTKFFKTKKGADELREAADEEKYVLQLSAKKVSDNMHTFSCNIQELDKELNAAAQAIRDAKANGESEIRIRTMQNDFRLLVKSRDMRERMLSDFECIRGLIYETYEMVRILYDQERFFEIIELIPEKSLPLLIRSGKPSDLYRLKDLLIEVNRSLEERLATVVTIYDEAKRKTRKSSAVTDVMVMNANSADKEMEEIETRFNLNLQDAAQDMQPVKVTKKALDVNEAAND